MITLNDLLTKRGIDPKQVIVMRHSLKERELRRVLPWLVHERPELFNAYQQTHSTTAQNAMEKLVGKGYVVSFVGLEAGKAVFAGLYKIASAKELDFKSFWKIPQHTDLKEYGMVGWKKEDAKQRTLWFDLILETHYSEWIGRMVIEWPPPAIAWRRRAENREMAISAVHEDSVFAKGMPDWQNLVLSWAELKVIPSRWRRKLEEWRAIYHIRDLSDGRSYVGSAYGTRNLYGRWKNYAESGHGDNVKLVERDPTYFHFSILQRLSPDLEIKEVVALENAWKIRLQTTGRYGLNSN